MRSPGQLGVTSLQCGRWLEILLGWLFQHSSMKLLRAHRPNFIRSVPAVRLVSSPSLQVRSIFGQVGSERLCPFPDLEITHAGMGIIVLRMVLRVTV